MREKRHEKADPAREVEVLCNIAASELLLEAMYLPPLDGNDWTPRAVALVMSV